MGKYSYRSAAAGVLILGGMLMGWEALGFDPLYFLAGVVGQQWLQS